MRQTRLTIALTLFVCSLGVSGQPPEANVRSLPAITSRAEFDSLARIYSDSSYPLSHVLFVIDRRDRNKIYYVNSRRYAFHKDFVNGTYLSLERGQEFFENNYLKANRRFMLGTLAYQTPVQRWTFEFWEGDQISGELIKTASEVINKTFFTTVAYKPNSSRQEEASAVTGLERVLQSALALQNMNVKSRTRTGPHSLIEKLA